MKLKVTAYLIKEGSTFDDIVRTDLEGMAVQEMQIEEFTSKLYYRKVPSRPIWLELFQNVNSEFELSSESIQSLLVINYEEFYICFTFGHARHFIRQGCIERNFGLKIALNISDPEQFKSIDKTQIKRKPIKSRHQSAEATSLYNFDFKFDWEILKGITGKALNENTLEHELITGSDSVSLITDIENISDLIDIANKLIVSYQLDTYKQSYPWIDYIIPIRDNDLIDTLDNAVLSNINNNELSDIWMTLPLIVEYEVFEGIKYNLRKSLRHEIDLEHCLNDKGKSCSNINLQYIKSSLIHFFYSHEGQQETHTWSIYECLNAELVYNDETYVLNEGLWFKVDDGYSNSLDSFFNEHIEESFSLPVYNGLKEGEYLEEVSNNDNNLILMDKKLIQPNPSDSRIEFADLITRDNKIIHVKKYTSSSTLSHLFSQASVSCNVMLDFSHVTDLVNEKIEENDYSFELNVNEIPRKHEIYLGIMQKGRTPLHLPFFSKVNFKQHCIAMRDRGYKVRLLKIKDF